ncbi:MAG: hypothetical protein IKX79_00310, partial [Desulfovibrionaceae bacterium]|nr:hypothetical protein [Desulfovibrionaceae bacterium]
VRLNCCVPVKQLPAQVAGEGHGFPNGFAPFLPGLPKQEFQAFSLRLRALFPRIARVLIHLHGFFPGGTACQGRGLGRLNAGVPVKQLLAQTTGEGHGFPNGFAPFLPGLLKQKIQAHFFSSLASRCRIDLLFICIRMASARVTS